MAKFKYHTLKKMDERDGNKFSTTYYQQTLKQKAEVYKHCRDIAETLSTMTDTDTITWLNSELKGNRRKDGTCYTPQDIICDMVLQLEADKDIASGLLGRWNKIWAGTDAEIELELEQKPPKNRFGDLFGDDDEE